ncbi:MAG: DUF4258 domain-containing protein [Flavobacteriaceae bacterium]|nr:MAG: DUF4258 domain-containing protein [Flavobacteriaceae bacterium]
MRLIKRIGYYVVGLSLGSVVVFFIWKEKGVTFDYGPDARTLKTIRIKHRLYSEQAKRTLLKNNLDTLAVNSILKHGDVHFGKSNQHKKPCAEYYISDTYDSKKLAIWVIRCDSTATIDTIWLR